MIKDIHRRIRQRQTIRACARNSPRWRPKRTGRAVLVVPCVLEWSPYSFLTMEEIAERHKLREKEVIRAPEAVVDPVCDKLRADGLNVSSEVPVWRSGRIPGDLAAKARRAIIVVVQGPRTSRHASWARWVSR